MKKAIAILTIALLGGNTINAQDDTGMRFGVKAAPALAWVRPDSKSIESDGSRFGYSLGLLAEFPVGSSGNYRFATGAFLNSIGGKMTSKSETSLNGVTSSVVSNSELKLQYVELPVTIKMMTNEIGYMRYYVQLGGTAAVNTKARGDVTITTNTNGVTSSASEDDVDLMDDTNVFKAGLLGGIGAEYNFSGNTSLVFGVTYNGGLTKVLKDDATGGENAKVRANYVELTVGVFF